MNILPKDEPFGWTSPLYTINAGLFLIVKKQTTLYIYQLGQIGICMTNVKRLLRRLGYANGHKFQTPKNNPLRE